MRVRDLAGLDPRIADELEKLGYKQLWPSQSEGAAHAVAGRNLVLAVPTASGKSLVAYLALLNHAARGGKGLYIVPLRALASEKFEDLKALAKPLGLRVALSIGDLDEAEPRLQGFDIIVCTSEKADALMRHRAHWLTQMRCIVSDEVHLLNDAGRGPTLEVLLARFKQLNPEAQIVALSATIANSKQLAGWLGAEHVQNEWRPVQLNEGILYGKGIQFLDNSKRRVNSEKDDAVLALTEDSVAGGGQVLVFVNTRKSTESVADKLRTVVKPHLPPESLKALKEAADRIKKGDGDATTVEAKLAKCVASGVAFHHAGLTNVNRALVEQLFKEGHLKALTATPTLAAGVNLPSRRVVIRDLWRFEDGGQQPIPVLEYKQMAGRAGRPKYDTVGEAITIAKNYDQRSEILLSYLLADPESVYSKLGAETALRTHVLSSIATGFVKDEASLQAFIKHTFYAYQNDAYTINAQITGVIDFLLEHELITATGDAFEATRFGKRVSELYVDPLSAVKLREALDAYPVKRATDVSFLHAVSATPDMRPLYIRKGDDWLEPEALERGGELLLEPPRGMEYEFFLSELKTACLLKDWIEEKTEEDLLKKYNVYPGDIHQKVDTAVWLLYAMQEVAKLFQKDATKPLARLGVRVTHGAKEELLPLLKFRGVGRYRARQLFAAGYKGEEDLKRASLADLTKVPGIGPGVAKSLKREVGDEPTPADVEEAQAEVEAAAPSPGPKTAGEKAARASSPAGQSSLSDFGA